MNWLKADFHMHTSDCLYDGIPHTAFQLIDRAATLGFNVLAITNHRHLIFCESWRDYAGEHGILLLPGVEASIKHKHVLIINANSDAEKLHDFDDLRSYRRDHNVLIIAPHPLYPGSISLRKRLLANLELFDALEFNSYYTRRFNPNLLAAEFAREHGKPLVGGSDTHRLRQLGKTCTMIQADQNIDSIFTAVRQGRVRVVTQPMLAVEAISLIVNLRRAKMRQDLKRLFRPSRLRRAYLPCPSDTSARAASKASLFRQLTDTSKAYIRESDA
jgi:predicted metal-dependent phosphoesterase TrpH